MKFSDFLASISVLVVAIGCSAAPGDDHAAKLPGDPQKHGPEPPGVAPLIRGSASGTLPIEKPEDCRPLELPVGFFFTGEFGPDTVVNDTATPTSATQCLYEQVLAATADSWANLVYTVVCGGVGDVALCCTQATRMCSVDLLMRWAEERTEPFEWTDLYGFKYVIPPLDKAARTSVDRRTVQEVAALLFESYVVVAEHTLHTRNCPDEDLEQIMRNYLESFDLHRRLSQRLASE